MPRRRRQALKQAAAGARDFVTQINTGRGTIGDDPGSGMAIAVCPPWQGR